MVTAEQFKEIGLNVDEISGNAALEWLAEKTTIDTGDITALPASAKLFIRKFAELQGTRAGVASQSIEGLSQSFHAGDSSAILWQYALEFLSPFLKSQVTFTTTKKRWL